jgi:nicotinamidase-related amidase
MVHLIFLALVTIYLPLSLLAVPSSEGVGRPKAFDMEKLNSKNTSLVVIDVQNYFIPGYPGAISPPIPGQNEKKKLANVLSLIMAAKKNGLNTFVTFEANDRGIDAMPAEMEKELPAEKCFRFIKGYFDLTKKPELSSSLDRAGVGNIVVCGAETDVCVIQSVTGLIKKGYQVYLAEDAVFTSTTLNEPALKRMQMAGARLVKTAEAIWAIENTGIPAIENKFEKAKGLPDIEADKAAILIVNYDDESLAKVSDPKKEQKKTRIKYLNHYAEVLEIPVYYLHDSGVKEIKKDLHLCPQVQFMNNAGSYQKSVEDLARILENRKVLKIVLGGIDEDSVVQGSALALNKSGFEVHLMEDVYFRDGGMTTWTELDGLYHSGIIPSSFKMFIYDATEGIQAVIKKRWREMFRSKLAKKEILWVDELPFVKDSQ